MHVRCTNCSARYRILDEYGGRMGRCSQCDARFILPIPDAQQLLGWASTTPWDKLLRFLNNSGARGHSESTINKFVRIYETRRWAEEERVRRETAQKKNQPLLSRREKIWETSEQRLRRRKTLEELHALDPSKFEQFVADLYSAQGYIAKATGGYADNGIDVQIETSEGKLWGVAQCKRFDPQNRVAGKQIREFGGAYMQSGADHGFFFTTGLYTRHANRTAQGFPWLTIYNGQRLTEYISRINEYSE